MKLWIGLDPGILGAIAFLGEDGSARVEDMPSAVVVRTKRDYLVGELAAMLDASRAWGSSVSAILERGIPMPRQAVQTTYAMGRGGGLVEGVLAALCIPYETVQPSAWKKAMGLTGLDKSASRVLAQKLWPQLTPDLKRVRDDGRAEALLLAEWGRRRG